MAKLQRWKLEQHLKIYKYRHDLGFIHVDFVYYS